MCVIIITGIDTKMARYDLGAFTQAIQDAVASLPQTHLTGAVRVVILRRRRGRSKVVRAKAYDVLESFAIREVMAEAIRNAIAIWLYPIMMELGRYANVHALVKGVRPSKTAHYACSVVGGMSCVHLKP